MKFYADSRSGIKFKAAAIALMIVLGLLTSEPTLAQTVSDDFNATILS